MTDSISVCPHCHRRFEPSCSTAQDSRFCTQGCQSCNEFTTLIYEQTPKDKLDHLDRCGTRTGKLTTAEKR